MLTVSEILNATKGKLLNGNIDENINDFKIDSREVKEGDFYVPLIGERVDGHKFIGDTVNKKCSGFFIAEDETINLDEIKKINSNIVIIQVKDTLQALYNIGLYNRDKHSNIEIVGITGSVGKTSTREMIASVLKQNKDILVTQKNFNGHIGLPIMSLLLNNQELAVFEAGIDFVGEMDLLGNILKPEVAVITNIGTSHIGKFKDRETIYKEKTKLANYLIGKKILLLNKDDEYLRNYRNDDVNIKYYSINDAKKIDIKEDFIEFYIDIYGKEEKITVNAIGNHNIVNAIIAIRIGEIYKLPTDMIVKGIKEYRNFVRRMEKINLNKFTIIDDTYNASLNSTESGLRTVESLKYKRKIAVLADILELGEYAQELHKKLGEVFKELHFNILIAYGENMKYLIDNASKYVDEVYYFEDAQKAEEKLRELIKEGDIIYFKGSNAMNVNNIVENLKRDFMN